MSANPDARDNLAVERISEAHPVHQVMRSRPGDFASGVQTAVRSRKTSYVAGNFHRGGPIR